MLLLTFLEVLFKGIGYSLVIYAFWLLAGSHFYNTFIKSGIRKHQTKKRIKRLRSLEQQEEESKKQSPLIQHLEMILSSVSRKGEARIANFIMLSVIMMGVMSILLIVLLSDVFFSILIGLITGLLPYMVVRYRLASIRLKTSMAFLNEFHIILQNYLSTNKNVYYMLLQTVEEMDDKYLKQQFRKLISSFQKERGSENVKKQVHLFIFSINSTFAKRFGNLLLKAYLESANIGNSLSTLSNDVVERKKAMDNESTTKLETIMIGFAPIVVLPFMLLFAYRITGVIDFWHYFKIESSLTLFIITVLCSVFSVLLAFLIRKPKADI